MKAINIEGQKFGYLTAIEPIVLSNKKKGTGRSYRCICDCGSEVVRLVSNLRCGGKRQSCGCKYSLFYEEEHDLTGKQFDDLLVSKRLGTHRSSKSVLYLCKCICGNLVELTSKALQRRKKKNCGCKAIPGKKLPGDEAIFNKLKSNYKSNAKRKRLSFSLSDEQCRNLFRGNCFYCGVGPTQSFKHKKCRGEFIHNGIDRLNSDEGYINGNVVSCCTFCNFKKRETPYQDFLDWISKIYHNRINDEKRIFR